MWEKVRVGRLELLALKHIYITICKIDDQGKFKARSTALKAGVLGQPRDGVGREVGGAQDEGNTYTHD